MDNCFNFNISDKGVLSKQCIEYNILSYTDACNYVKELPYGRNSNRIDFSLVLKEQKGTCSSKHAFLKRLALENEFEAISLYIGIYKMNAKNTVEVESVLEKHQLGYIPEAHTYLKYKDTIFDFTSTNASDTSYKSVLYEEKIDADQVRYYKVKLHHQFLKSWIEENNIPYTFEELWTIREECILALS